MTSEEKISLVERNKITEWLRDFFIRVPFVQKMLFVHNLEVMVKAGLSVVGALKILSEQVENKRLRAILAEVKNEVEKGQPLSDVLDAYPKVFPSIYVSMIRAGEESGKLEQALSQIAEQMKKSNELTSRIHGALIYPAVVFSAMLAIAAQMVVFVLPKIIGTFDELHADLPLPTRILSALVKFVAADGVFVLVGLVALAFLGVWLVKQPRVRRQVHAFNLHLPIAGRIIKQINLASFTLTLSSLLQSAIPIIDAVRITAEVQTNVVYREKLFLVAEALKKGQTLSDILVRFPRHFPPMVTQMIMVGEESGQVEKMLGELAAYYGNEVDTTMRNFSTIIEPVIILGMGVAVAGMAVAVILPMYSLVQGF